MTKEKIIIPLKKIQYDDLQALCIDLQVQLLEKKQEIKKLNEIKEEIVKNSLDYSNQIDKYIEKIDTFDRYLFKELKKYGGGGYLQDIVDEYKRIMEDE